MTRSAALRPFVAASGVCLFSLFSQAAPVDGEPGIPKGGGCESYQGYGDYLDGQTVGFGQSVPATFSLVQAFIPPNYPWAYDAFCVCLRGDGVNTSFNYDIVVFDDDGPNEEPGTVLRKFSGQVATVPGGNGCNYFTTEGLDIPVVYDGFVYIGIAWEPVNEPGIAWGVDSSNNGFSPPKFRSFDEFQSWEENTSDFAYNFRARGSLYCEQTFTGRLEPTSPTWNRASTLATSLNCNAIAEDAVENGQYFQAIPVSSESGGRLIFEIQSASGSITDTTLSLYCDPFNPEDPMQNLIAYDDDAGPGSLSAFTYSDNLSLVPGDLYWLVVSTFSSGAIGTFEACLSNGYRIDACSQAITGNLDEASSTFQRPTVQSTSTPTACNASAIDAGVAATPYQVFQLTVDNLALLEAEVHAVPGGLSDAYLLLYCDFDPTNPLVGIVAGSDSGGGDGLGGFAPEDGLYLSPGAIYYLVVTSDTTNAADFGAYELCVSPGVNIQRTLVDCVGGAEVSQPPTGPSEDWVATDLGNSILGDYYDNFGDLTAPITRVSWWAHHVQNGTTACTRAADDTYVRLYTDNAGEPGTMVHDEVVSTPGIDEGVFYEETGELFSLVRYDITLAAPVDLASGWISVGPMGDDPCEPYWISARSGGDGVSARSATAGKYFSVSRDYSFCLYTGARTHTTDQNGDSVISLSELLRLIQFYNSLALHCDALGEDGYAPGTGDESCAPHNADYAPQDWVISLSELLRVIQFYNSLGYSACPDANTEDGFCPGPAN